MLWLIFLFFCRAITFHVIIIPITLTVLLLQVDVLDRLGGGPQGEQARQNWARLDGRLQQKRVPDQQNSAVAQRSESGHPTGHPLLGGRLLRPHRDGLPQQLWAQGQHLLAVVRIVLLRCWGEGVQRNKGSGLFWQGRSSCEWKAMRDCGRSVPLHYTPQSF